MFETIVGLTKYVQCSRLLGPRIMIYFWPNLWWTKLHRDLYLHSDMKSLFGHEKEVLVIK